MFSWVVIVLNQPTILQPLCLQAIEGVKEVLNYYSQTFDLFILDRNVGREKQ